MCIAGESRSCAKSQCNKNTPVRHARTRLGLDAQCHVLARRVFACPRTHASAACSGVHMTLVQELQEQTSRVPRVSPCGAPMDCCDLPPRLAFGHLDSDGCLEDGLMFDILLAVIPGDREPVQHPKTLISWARSVPESDQVLPLNGRQLGVRRRLE